jgi:hypothetical protein
MVARWDAAGSAVWSTAYDPGTDAVGDLAVAPTGDVYALGFTDAPTGLPFAVGRISAGGEPMWTTAIPSNADENLTCGIAPLPDGGAMVCVAFEHGVMGIQRFSPEGAALWEPATWFAADCGAVGTVNQIAPSPDGTVVMLTSTGVAKIAL